MGEMILLGAGASVDAGVPDAYGMTTKILDAVNKGHRSEFKPHQQILNFVVGGLLRKAGEENKNPYESAVNVEDLFNAIFLLSERNSLDVAPFIQSWHPFVDACDQTAPDLSYEIKEAFRSFIDAIESKARVDNYGRIDFHQPRLDETARKLSGAIKSFDQRRAGNGKVFRQTSEQMIQLLKESVTLTDASQVEYLLPLIDVERNNGRLVVATLNYDNAIELASQSRDLPCNTGIDGWSETGSFDFSGPDLNLIKLHGSIDWKRVNHPFSEEKPMPNEGVVSPNYKTPENENRFRRATFSDMPAVVFGHRNKLTADGPFLDLLREFKKSLEESSSLTVVGYSFADAHINTHIANWINADPNNSITVIDPGFDRSKNAFVEGLRRLNRSDSSRLKVISKPAKEGIAEVFRTMYGIPVG